MRFKALEDARAELKTIFDAAGPEIDLSKVDIPGCKSAAEKTVHIKKLGDRIEEMENVAKAAGYSGAHHERGDTGGTKTGGADPAKRQIEALVKSKALPEHAAGLVDGLLRSEDRREADLTKRWIIAAGDDAYESAFMKLMSDPAKGHLKWSAEEQAAYVKADAVRAEMKGLFTNSGTGSFLIPLTLDPSVILSNDGRVNPLRALARVVQTATGKWQGVSSDGVTAEWLAEGAEAAEATPTFVDPEIETHKASVYCEYSIEWEHDAIDGRQELRMLMVDAIVAQQSTAYTLGTGTGQPKGLITALAAAPGSVVAPTVAESLTSPDVYKVRDALAPRWQPRADWLANLAILGALEQMETAGGALKFPELRNNPPTLLRRDIYELSEMDGAINPAATAANHVLVYGDLKQFVIVDSIGTTVEFIPTVIGANRRPVGKRGIWMYYRTGSDVVVPKAFRMLNVATTA